MPGLGCAPTYIMLTLPAALSLGPIACCGAFVAHDVLMTRNALVGYSVGLILLLVKVLALLLCSAGYQDPGEDRHSHACRHPIKPAVCRLAAACGAGTGYRSRFLPQFCDSVLSVAQARHISAEPGWLRFVPKIAAALLAFGSCRGLAWVPSSTVDHAWLGAGCASELDGWDWGGGACRRAGCTRLSPQGFCPKRGAS